MTSRERIYLRNKNRKSIFILEGPMPTAEQQERFKEAIEKFINSDRKVLCLFADEYKIRVINL